MHQSKTMTKIMNPKTAPAEIPPTSAREGRLGIGAVEVGFVLVISLELLKCLIRSFLPHCWEIETQKFHCLS